jgi:hypothetical protein
MIAFSTPKGAFKIAKASVDIEVQVRLRGFHGLAKKAVRITAARLRPMVRMQNRLRK